MYLQKPMLGTQLDWSNPLNKGLVMHFAMNEGHGDRVQDLSLYGNHGTLKNFSYPPTHESGWNPGTSGVALAFDGSDDYIDFGDNPSLSFGTGDFTVEVRSKRIGNAGGDYPVLVSKGEIASDGWMLRHIGDVRLEVYAGGIFAHVLLLFINEWRQIIFTRRGDDCYMHIDGVQKTHDTGIGVKDFTTSDVGRIGNAGGKNTRFFAGQIDYVRLYNRALIESEVLERYMNPYGVYLEE